MNEFSFITGGEPKRDYHLKQFVYYSVILYLSIAMKCVCQSHSNSPAFMHLQLLVFVPMETCSVTRGFPRINLSVAMHLPTHFLEMAHTSQYVL
jgi:hypothetical protein